MVEIFTWIQTNLVVLTEILFAVLGLASLITGLTPTPDDDRVVGKLRDFVAKWSVLTYKDQPGTFKRLGKTDV